MKHAKRKRGDHVGFESSSLSIAITSDNRLANLAEVVGSNPSRSIIINLVNYGIRLSSFTTFLNLQ
jgi:hypothetical protein